jgi:glycosyltransferase involved in cell wall biosynthesis
MALDKNSKHAPESGGAQLESAGTYLLVLPWDLEVVGGVNQVVVNLYQQFERDGRLKPLLLVGDWEARNAPVDQVHPSGLRIVRLGVRPPFEKGWLPWELARFATQLPGELRKLSAFVRRYDVRVVNCHFIGSDALTWALAKATGAFRGKLIFSLHGLDIRTLAQLRGLRKRIWKRALESVDAVIACSQGLADETIAAFGLSGRNVITIHNGVRADRLEELSKAAVIGAADTDHRRLVNLGTFEHKKGHDVLLKAFSGLSKRFPDVRLSILGRAADKLEPTRALARELDLEDRVSIRANVPHGEALAILKQADLFVLPSRNEAFSVALLEAGAMGKPVVATRVCGVPELIHDRTTGVLVPSDDVKALEEGMAYMLSSPQAAKQYGNALRDRVLEKFTAEATFRNYFALTQSG